MDERTVKTQMRVLIIEDEPAAARRLRKLLAQIDPAIEVCGETDSVAASLRWFSENKAPDLILSDIELGDGLSFELFNELDSTPPIIFITAYDSYAIQAFEELSIDYLLKPIQKDRLSKAIAKLVQLGSAAEKLNSLKNNEAGHEGGELTGSGQVHPARTKTTRVIVRMGKQLIALNLNEAAYFYSRNKIVVYYGFDGKRYPVDLNLEELENRLNPSQFFRINRQCILKMEAISEMFNFSKSRIKVTLSPPFDEDTIVSKERYSRFKRWLKGEDASV